MRKKNYRKKSQFGRKVYISKNGKPYNLRKSKSGKTYKSYIYSQRFGTVWPDEPQGIKQLAAMPPKKKGPKIIEGYLGESQVQLGSIPRASATKKKVKRVAGRPQTKQKTGGLFNWITGRNNPRIWNISSYKRRVQSLQNEMDLLINWARQGYYSGTAGRDLSQRIGKISEKIKINRADPRVYEIVYNDLYNDIMKTLVSYCNGTGGVEGISEVGKQGGWACDAPVSWNQKKGPVNTTCARYIHSCSGDKSEYKRAKLKFGYRRCQGKTYKGKLCKNLTRRKYCCRHRK